MELLNRYSPEHTAYFASANVVLALSDYFILTMY
jgi:hypothetical protein